MKIEKYVTVRCIDAGPKAIIYLDHERERQTYFDLNDRI